MAKMYGNLSPGGGENGDHGRQPLQKLKNWFSQGLYISEDNKCNVRIDLEAAEVQSLEREYQRVLLRRRRIGPTRSISGANKRKRGGTNRK